MKDLRSQLAEKLGRSLPPEPAPPAAPERDLLHPNAHLDDPWIGRLRGLKNVPGGPEVPDSPSLEAARQLTDRLAKALKKGGRARDAEELKDLRDRFLARREKLAWSRVKERFQELALSDRAYRALKQEGTDPTKALARLENADPAELQAMGAARLRERLS